MGTSPFRVYSGFEPTVWTETTFKPSLTFIESLEAAPGTSVLPGSEPVLWCPAPGCRRLPGPAPSKAFSAPPDLVAGWRYRGLPFFVPWSDFLSSFGSYRSTASGAPSGPLGRPLLRRTSVALRAPCVLPKSNSRRASPFQATKQFTQKDVTAPKWDRSTPMAAPEAIRKAGRDASRPPRWHPKLLPHQSAPGSSGSRQRQHQSPVT